jgi:hypothetical protein
VTKLMVKESIPIAMELNMMENGKMIYSMVLEQNHGMIALSIKVNTRKERSMV